MATAKKSAAKAAAIPKKVTTPAKVVKPVSKTAKVIAKISASIAKMTERKDKIFAEIKALRDQRAALKVVPATAAPVAPKATAKAAPKVATPKKVAKPAAKK